MTAEEITNILKTFQAEPKDRKSPNSTIVMKLCSHALNQHHEIEQLRDLLSDVLIEATATWDNQAKNYIFDDRCLPRFRNSLAYLVDVGIIGKEQLIR